MEIGTDPTELFASDKHKNLDIIYNDKIWKFVIREITWVEKNQIISKSARVKDNSREFDVNVYNQLYLEKAIITAPFEMTKINILRLGDKFGDLLIESVVDRVEKIEVEEAEN